MMMIKKGDLYFKRADHPIPKSLTIVWVFNIKDRMVEYTRFANWGDAKGRGRRTKKLGAFEYCYGNWHRNRPSAS